MPKYVDKLNLTMSEHLDILRLVTVKIIEYNDNQNPSMSLVDFTNNKIQDKYVTFISRELSDIENGKNYLINFIKLSDLNSNISII